MARKKKLTTETTEKLSEKSRSLINDTRLGRWVSLDLLRANAWLLLLILVVVISLIGVRYKTKTKMAEIKQLTTELQRMESAMLQEKAEYMSLIRESEMKRLVEQRNLGLTFREQPPYEITEND